MRQGWTRAALALLLGGGLLQAVAGEVYRWQDSRGQWHFGDPGAAAPGSVVQRPVLPMSIIEPGPGSTAPAYTDEALPSRSGKRPAKMYSLKPLREQTASKKKRGRKADKGLAEPAPVMAGVDGREAHQRYCDRWREKLRKSRLGLRDHEAQDAYDRECILNVHW